MPFVATNLTFLRLELIIIYLGWGRGTLGNNIYMEFLNTKVYYESSKNFFIL